MRKISLDEVHWIYTGQIEPSLVPSVQDFDELWGYHPEEHSQIQIHGKFVKVPRWDQAYERDYPFAKQVAVAKPAPDCFRAYLDWCRECVDARINGMFVNWHDGSLGHYHGKHRDSVSGLVSDTPIVTVSLGQERVFRIRPYPDGKPPVDLKLSNGDVVVIPWNTNQAWTHEVPKFKRYDGRRISVTMRAFDAQP